MFGQQDDITTRDQQADINVTLPDNAIAALANEPAVASTTDSPTPAASAAPAIDDSSLPGASIAEPTTDTSTTATDSPLQPDSSAAPNDFLSPETPTVSPLVSGANPDATTQPALPENLLHIKQEALEALSPLVGQLDLNPEDKFRTLMMLIQASDNRDLVPEAYTAAKQIGDEKTRAQALLDIVNEINYFTRD